MGQVVELFLGALAQRDVPADNPDDVTVKLGIDRGDHPLDLDALAFGCYEPPFQWFCPLAGHDFVGFGQEAPASAGFEHVADIEATGGCGGIAEGVV